jgi:H+/Cl- antiporter ClcA
MADFLAGLIAMLLLVVPLWRIFGRAGLSPLLSLLALVPVLGLLIVSAILAYTDWPAARRNNPL